MNNINLAIAEAIIRLAIIANHKDEMKQLEQDATFVSFSAEHEKRMKRLFVNARAKQMTTIIWNVTCKIGLVAACVVTIFSTFLMFNPAYEYDDGVGSLEYEDSVGNSIFLAFPIGNSEINVDNKHSIYGIKNTDIIEYNVFTNTGIDYPLTIIVFSEEYNFASTGYYDIETLEKATCSLKKIAE